MPRDLPLAAAAPGPLTVLLLRRRTSLIAVLAAVFGALSSAFLSPVAPDAELFAAAAQQVTTGAWADVFTQARLQVGPVHLLLLVPFVLLASGLGLPVVPVAAAGLSAGLAVAVVLLVRRLAGVASPGAETGAGLAVVLGTPLYATAMAGHLEELVTVLLLLAAGLAVRGGRPFVAALLIGLAAACKLWGLLGVPVLLLDARPLLAAWRTQVRRCAYAAAAVGVLLLAYAPFLLRSHVATFEFAWLVAHPSPFALVAAGQEFTFGLRLLQGAVAVTAGVVLATTGPNRLVDRVWAVPAGVCLARLLVDPYVQSYYLAPVLALLLMGLWAGTATRPGTLPTAVLATAAAPLLLGALLVAEGPVGGAVSAVLVVALLAAVWRAEDLRALRDDAADCPPYPEVVVLRAEPVRV